MANPGHYNTTPGSPASADNQRQDRRFSVSSNRGRARHRIHYVETGGALVDNDECTFCQGNPADGETDRPVHGPRAAR